MIKLIPASALSMVLLAASPVAVRAEGASVATAAAQPAESVLNLSAYGEVRVAPDQASITLGVQTKAETAGEAMRQNAVQMNQVMAALRRAGLADKAIQTSNLSLEPQYTYVQDKPPLLNGYQASNDVVITVDDLAKLGSVLDAVVAAGANQVNGISFGLRDPNAAQDAARLAAVKALRAKADLYARATGYRLGRLISLTEGGGYMPEPYRPVMAMAAKASAPTPVSPGELSVRIDVSALYGLTQ